MIVEILPKGVRGGGINACLTHISITEIIVECRERYFHILEVQTLHSLKTRMKNRFCHGERFPKQF